MDSLTRFYQLCDPLRPLEADEEDLYVDWQTQVGFDDVKSLLTNSITRSTGVPVTRLFAGHRGAGKTTELKRVKQKLESGQAGRRILVSFVEAEESLDLQDVAAPDVVFLMVRQLVSDLKDHGFDFGWQRISSFVKEFVELLSSEVELRGIEIGADPLKFSLVLKDVPRARPVLRSLLEGKLPTIYDLVNGEILGEARKFLPKHEYDDILLIVDQLDRIPRKVINGRGLTNHENLFLDHARTLRALACHVLFTIPTELVYSLRRVDLQNAYGTEIHTLPTLPVHDRTGEVSEPGARAMARVVELRAQKAGLQLSQVFDPLSLLDRFVQLSGGHLRSLFVLLRAALDRVDRLPITEDVANRAVRRAASDLALPLRRRDWEALERIHSSKGPLEDPNDAELWNELLCGLYVFTYEDERGRWYDWNPLLGEVPPEDRR